MSGSPAQPGKLPLWQYSSTLSTSSIRIIQLLPAHHLNDLLECRMIEMKIRDHPLYIALSYVWGSEEKPLEIICHDTILPITSNLDSALRHIRMPNEEVSLWVDSICINQEDIAERHAQVQAMSDIYWMASKVIVWLGNEDEFEDTSAAVEYMQFLFKEALPVFVEVAEAGTIPHDDTRSKKIGELAGTQLTQLSELRKLFQRPWFDRAWTYQESCLARDKEFYCGRYRIPNESMVAILGGLWTVLKATNSSKYGLFYDPRVQSMILDGTSKPGRRNELDDLLNVRRGAGCRKPSDIIYSLLGLSTDFWRSTILPDYRKTFQEVFAETSVEIIRARGNLNILSAVNHKSTTSSDLPTWTPDWRQHHEEYLCFTYFGYDLRNPTFGASGLSKPIIQLSSNSLQLTIRSLVLDVISLKSTQPSLMGHWRWVTENLSNGILPKTYSFTEEPIDEVLIKATTGDMTRDKKRFDAPFMKFLRDGIEDFQHFGFLAEPDPYHILDISKILNPLGSITYPSFTLIDNDGSPGFEFDQELAGNRDSFLMITQKGIIGSVSSVAKPGDVIIIPLGGQVPIVIRPCNDKFIFLGECYCHGFMDGEAFVEARKKADPSYDGQDHSWLQRLHKEPIPFPTSDFILI